jgi:hypothetical protein
MAMLRACALVFGAALFPIVASAELYRYVDAEGQVLFTNVPIGQTGVGPSPPAKDPRHRLSSESKSARAARPVRVAVAPTDFPRVAAATQYRRDTLRKQILEDELRAEQSLLDSARARYQADEIHLHLQNVAALQQELARLKQ